MPFTQERAALFTLLGLPVYAYALFLALGCALGLLMALRRARRTGFAPGAVLTFALLAVPLAVCMGRLVFCACRFVDVLDYGFGYIFRLTDGGFSLIGVTLGLALAAFITGKISKLPVLALTDCVLPGLLMALAVARFAEGSTTNGTGPEVSVAALSFFPLAVEGLYGDARYAVFMGEGLTALVAALWTQAQGVSRVDGGEKPPMGWVTGIGLVIVSAAQIVWESARRDEVLKNGFVRYAQIFAGIVLFIVLVAAFMRLRVKVVFACAATAIFLILLGICAFIEFLIDGKVIQDIPLWACYLADTVCAGGAGVLVARVVNAACGFVAPSAARP